MVRLNRREFVIATTAACACAMCGEVADAAPTPQQVDVGPVADYPSNIISDKFRKPHKILIVRNDEQIYALSAVCTHKSCVVKVKDGQIKCPCHGSQYTEHGTVTDGPAKRSLPRYAISLNEQNHLIVDKSKQFDEREWEDSASFVRIS